MSDKTDANEMWGGRFASGPDAVMEAINASIDFDQRLYAQDIAGSKAHVAMLAAQGIVTAEDAAAIAAIHFTLSERLMRDLAKRAGMAQNGAQGVAP